MGLHTLHTIFYYRVNPFPNSDLTTLRVSLSELLTPQLVSRGHEQRMVSGWSSATTLAFERSRPRWVQQSMSGSDLPVDPKSEI